MAEYVIVYCRETHDYDGAVYVCSDGTILAGPEGAKPWQCPPCDSKVDKTGYPRVYLARGGKTMACFVHRLVAQCHVAGYRPDLNAHHRDGNKLNPNARNLTCMTRGEHTTLHSAGRPMRRGEELAHAKLTEAEVLEMRRRRSVGESYSAIAADYAVSEVAAWKAITGRTWRHLPGAVLKRGGAQIGH